MKIIARRNQDEQCCKIIPHRCALNLLQELSLDANCVFLTVRMAQLSEEEQQPGSWVPNHMPVIFQVTLRKSLLPLCAPSVLLVLFYFSRLETLFYHGQPLTLQSGRVAVTQTSLRWGLNIQNKHSGKEHRGCLRFPGCDQVLRFLLSMQWEEPWDTVLL